MTRIGIIGNMNNNGFAFARHLRRRGHDVTLCPLNTDPRHFLPSADYSDDPSDMAFIRPLLWGDLASYAILPVEHLRADVADFDILFACGAAPAFLARAGRRVDVFFPYGSDSYDLPFFRFKDYGSGPIFSRKSVRYHLQNWRFCRDQQRGIGSARFVLNANDTWQRLIRRCGFRGARLPYVVPMLFLNGQGGSFPQGRFSAEIDHARAQSDLMIVHSSRHVWVTRNDPYSVKANDRLLRGFARFLSQTGTRAVLVTFEYGPDVAHSKRLAAELGCQEQILWLPQAERRDILPCIAAADVVATMFERSWILGGAAMEGLALGRPVIQYREDRRHAKEMPELPPLLNARTADEISARLVWCLENPEERRAYGEAGRRWVNTHAIEAPLNAIEQALAQLATEGSGGRS